MNEGGGGGGGSSVRSLRTTRSSHSTNTSTTIQRLQKAVEQKKAMMEEELAVQDLITKVMKNRSSCLELLEATTTGVEERALLEEVHSTCNDSLSEALSRVKSIRQVSKKLDRSVCVLLEEQQAEAQQQAAGLVEDDEESNIFSFATGEDSSSSVAASGSECWSRLEL